LSTNEIAVSYEPFKEIVIMEKTLFNSPEEIARFTSTAIVAKELLEKHKVYWTFVGYAMMPKYMQIIETKEKMIVPVVEITSDPILKAVALWLKEQKQ
jgi:ABC-type enterochelin transport system permease subunit